MVTCKIMVDFDEPKASFSGFFKDAAMHGQIISDSSTGAMFFASADNGVTVSSVRALLEKHGFTQAFVKEFDLQHMPQAGNETEERYGWLIDNVVQQSKKQYEQDHSQELIANYDALDALDTKILESTAQLLKQQQAQKPKEDNKNDAGTH